MELDTSDILKLVAAILLIAAGTWQYRRRVADPENRYGSQSAVPLLAIGLILPIVALGGLEYRSSPSEIDAAQ